MSLISISKKSRLYKIATWATPASDKPDTAFGLIGSILSGLFCLAALQVIFQMLAMVVLIYLAGMVAGQHIVDMGFSSNDPGPLPDGTRRTILIISGIIPALSAALVAGGIILGRERLLAIPVVDAGDTVTGRAISKDSYVYFLARRFSSQDQPDPENGLDVAKFAATPLAFLAFFSAAAAAVTLQVIWNITSAILAGLDGVISYPLHDFFVSSALLHPGVIALQIVVVGLIIGVFRYLLSPIFSLVSRANGLIKIRE